MPSAECAGTYSPSVGVIGTLGVLAGVGSGTLTGIHCDTVEGTFVCGFAHGRVLGSPRICDVVFIVSGNLAFVLPVLTVVLSGACASIREFDAGFWWGFGSVFISRGTGFLTNSAGGV